MNNGCHVKLGVGFLKKMGIRNCSTFGSSVDANVDFLFVINDWKSEATWIRRGLCDNLFLCSAQFLPEILVI